MARGFGSTFGAGTTDVVQSVSLAAGGNQRSYSVWVATNGLGGSNTGRVFAKSAAAATTFQEGIAITSSGNFAFVRGNSGGTKTADHKWAQSTSDNLWHHICVTHDQTAGAPTVYLDGVSVTVSTDANFSQGASGSSSVYIGNASAGTRAFNGRIAWLVIWDNLLLSAVEASALAAGMNPLQIRSQNLVLLLPLDGISNPEPDWINGYSSSITGTGFSQDVPPVPYGGIRSQGFSLPGVLYSGASLTSSGNFVSGGAKVVRKGSSLVNSPSFVGGASSLIRSGAALTASGNFVSSAAAIIRKGLGLSASGSLVSTDAQAARKGQGLSASGSLVSVAAEAARKGRGLSSNSSFANASAILNRLAQGLGITGSFSTGDAQVVIPVIPTDINKILASSHARRRTLSHSEPRVRTVASTQVRRRILTDRHSNTGVPN